MKELESEDSFSTDIDFDGVNPVAPYLANDKIETFVYKELHLSLMQSQATVYANSAIVKLIKIGPLYITTNNKWSIEKQIFGLFFSDHDRPVKNNIVLN